jgi:hypothetical protein
MTIYIPATIALGVGISIAWAVLAFLFSRYVWIERLQAKAERDGKSHEWPTWLAFVSAGPIGWLCFLGDLTRYPRTDKTWTLRAERLGFYRWASKDAYSYRRMPKRLGIWPKTKDFEFAGIWLGTKRTGVFYSSKAQIAKNQRAIE